MAVTEKRPVVLRTVLALIVIAVFAWSTYPLQERDFYETFVSVLKKADDPAAKKLVDDAKALQAKSPDVFASNALLSAANSQGVLLSDLAKLPAAEDNRDSISSLRKLTSASIRRGIDLAGGVEFMMELVPDQDFLARIKSMDAKSKEEAAQRMDEEFNRYRDLAIEVLRKRLESNHIYESEIAPAGGRFISLKAPITSKDEKSQLKNKEKAFIELKSRIYAAMLQQQP